MSDAAPRPSLRSAVGSPVLLWIAFVLVHAWLGLLAFIGPIGAIGDVTLVYRYWVENGVSAHQWVAFDLPWVYPVVALLPMVASNAFGSALYASTWLSLVMLVDAAAFAVIMGFGRDRRVAHVAWWWLALVTALGPLALGRIDAFVAPVAIVGLLCLAGAPRLAGAMLALAAWIKVWPAALIAAALIALRTRVRVLVGVLITTAIVVVVDLVLGGGRYLLSFVTQQTGRGLQIESGIGTFWMWDAVLHPGRSTLYYDRQILTFQLTGPGVEIGAAVATPLLAIAVAALLAIAVWLTRRGIPAVDVLPPLSLAITTALIVFNKVGSPQFVTWLAVPIVFGLSAAAVGRGVPFRLPAILALVIAAVTQLIYPLFYDQLLFLNPVMVAVLTLRNLLYLALLVWSVRALVGLRHGIGFVDSDVRDWLPDPWPFGRRHPA